MKKIVNWFKQLWSKIFPKSIKQIAEENPEFVDTLEHFRDAIEANGYDLLEDLNNSEAAGGTMYANNIPIYFASDPSIQIALADDKDFCLEYFAQMAWHIENLYQQAIVDLHINHVSNETRAKSLIKECREATKKLKEDFDRYSENNWFKPEE